MYYLARKTSLWLSRWFWQVPKFIVSELQSAHLFNATTGLGTTLCSIQLCKTIWQNCNYTLLLHLAPYNCPSFCGPCTLPMSTDSFPENSAVMESSYEWSSHVPSFSTPNANNTHFSSFPLPSSYLYTICSPTTSNL